MTDYSIPYNHYEHKWFITKPIRGRSEDTRPVGKRYRDWETITREERGDTVVFGLRLHSTTCVEYYPDGNVLIRHGGWQTPSTAKFINQHAPMACYKERGKLFVRKNGGTKYPLNATGIMFKPQGGTYVPVDPVLVKKEIVDRIRARDARVPLQPFLEFARAFLALSDGWIMHETRKQVLGWTGEQFATHISVTSQDLYERMLADPSDETHLYILCMLPSTMYMDSKDTRAAEKTGGFWTFRDHRIPYDRVKGAVYGWVKQFADVKKEVVVQIA